MDRITLPRYGIIRDAYSSALNLHLFHLLLFNYMYVTSSLFHKSVWNKLFFFWLFPIFFFLINLFSFFFPLSIHFSFLLEDLLNHSSPLFLCSKIHQQGSVLKVQVFPICRDSGISLGLRYLILQTKFNVSLNFFSPKLAGNVKINKSLQTWNSVLLNITNNCPFLNTATLGNLKQQEGLPLL